jgi:hypothetical protein
MIVSVWVIVKFVIGCVAFYGMGMNQRRDKERNKINIYQTVRFPANNFGNPFFFFPRQKFCEYSFLKSVIYRL